MITEPPSRTAGSFSELASMLRAARERKKIRQADLARNLDIDQGTLSHLETKAKFMPNNFAMVKQWGEAVGLDVAAAVGWG